MIGKLISGACVVVMGAIVGDLLFRPSPSMKILAEQGEILASTYSAMLGDPKIAAQRSEEEEALDWLQKHQYEEPKNPAPQHGEIWGGFIRW